MKRTGWKVYLEDDPSRRTIDLYLTHLGPSGESVARPVQIDMHSVEEGVRLEPTMTFYPHGYDGREILQAIVDAAAQKGIVARIDEAPANKIEAVERHLDDMRAIAGHKLGVNLK
jgi:hypothetical protein